MILYKFSRVNVFYDRPKPLWFKALWKLDIKIQQSHELKSERANERAQRRSRAKRAVQSKWVNGASKCLSGRASGPSFMTWFKDVLNHSVNGTEQWKFSAMNYLIEAGMRKRKQSFGQPRQTDGPTDGHTNCMRCKNASKNYMPLSHERELSSEFAYARWGARL